ncbi:hypothetical protein CC80DRAFT_532608 [Byssothecium circinans]|uniref:G domain-containing protein n=1 Tax=Byssothecium circinans TaxID=147558 RepID=A0A6A5U7V7_9PLEO|nr:hypothetical protein CC80DRAFT_532608 [Byssothecium circinans]
MSRLSIEKPTLSSIHPHMEMNEYVDTNDIFIAVFGVTGAGKSTFISLCTQEPPNPACHDLKSCTANVTIHTMTYNSQTIHLLDTPGFNDTLRTDAEILKELAYWLATAHERGYQLSGVIYLHSITDTRLHGSSMRALDAFKKLIGDENFPGVVLATTRWDIVRAEDMHIATERQKELYEGVWSDIIKGGGKSLSISAGRADALRIISHFIENSRHGRLTLAFQRQLVEEGIQLHKTDVGKVLFDQLEQDYTKLEKRLMDKEEKIKKKIHDGASNSSETREWRENMLNSMQPLQGDMHQMRKSLMEVREDWVKKLQQDAISVERLLRENKERLSEKQEKLSRLQGYFRSSSSTRSSQSNVSRWLDVPDSKALFPQRAYGSVRRRARSSSPSYTSISSSNQFGSFASEASLMGDIEDLGRQNESIEIWKRNRLDNRSGSTNNQGRKSTGWTVAATALGVGQLVAAVACIVM